MAPLSATPDHLVETSCSARTSTDPDRGVTVLDRTGTGLAVVEKVEPKDHTAQLRAVRNAL